MSRNAHASAVNDMLRESDEETYDCARCGDTWLNQGDAIACCSRPIDEWDVPSIEDIERERQRLGVSQSELSRRAGREYQAWNEILQRDMDPQLSTVQRFVDALKSIEPDDESPEKGRPAGHQWKHGGDE